jgi:hypothetical protein
MQKQEWDRLVEAIDRTRGERGNLYYHYYSLSGVIHPYADVDSWGRPKKSDASDAAMLDASKVRLAIENWAKVQQELERSCLSTHALTILGGEYTSEQRDELVPRLIGEKKLLSRAVVELHEGFTDRGLQTRPEVAQRHWQLVMRAIEEFERKPTALIAFPDQYFDCRIAGGFYGTPWSYAHSSDTLKFHVLQRLPFFEVRVIPLREKGQYGGNRSFGVLFSYRSPWGA